MLRLGYFSFLLRVILKSYLRFQESRGNSQLPIGSIYKNSKWVLKPGFTTGQLPVIVLQWENFSCCSENKK